MNMNMTMSMPMTAHGGCCCDEKHMIMRLEYMPYHNDPEQWASDKEYIEGLIPQLPQSMVNELCEHLDCSVYWTEGEGDGDTEDMCEAITKWYDNDFRPFLRNMCRFELNRDGMYLNWKAFECWLFEYHERCPINCPCGTMISVRERINELRD